MLVKLISSNRNSLDFIKCLCTAQLSKTAIEIQSPSAANSSAQPLQLKINSDQKATVSLTDPNAIALFLSSSEFAAKTDLLLSCQISQWLSVAASELRPFQGERSNLRHKREKFEHVSKVFQGLNHYLRLRTFLVDERLSLADVAVAIEIAPILPDVLIQITDEKKCDFQYLQRWFKTVANQPELRKIVDLENCPQAGSKEIGSSSNDQKSVSGQQTKEKAKKEKKSNQRQKPEANKKKNDSGRDDRKLRILCLHGYRQNEASFREKTGAFRKIVNKFADLTFISAPLKVPSSRSGEEEEEKQTDPEVSADLRFHSHRMRPKS